MVWREPCMENMNYWQCYYFSIRKHFYREPRKYSSPLNSSDYLQNSTGVLSTNYRKVWPQGSCTQPRIEKTKLLFCFEKKSNVSATGSSIHQGMKVMKNWSAKPGLAFYCQHAQWAQAASTKCWSPTESAFNCSFLSHANTCFNTALTPTGSLLCSGLLTTSITISAAASLAAHVTTTMCVVTCIATECFNVVHTRWVVLSKRIWAKLWRLYFLSSLLPFFPLTADVRVTFLTTGRTSGREQPRSSGQITVRKSTDSARSTSSSSGNVAIPSIVVSWKCFLGLCGSCSEQHTVVCCTVAKRISRRDRCLHTFIFIAICFSLILH